MLVQVNPPELRHGLAERPPLSVLSADPVAFFPIEKAGRELLQGRCFLDRYQSGEKLLGFRLGLSLDGLSGAPGDTVALRISVIEVVLLLPFSPKKYEVFSVTFHS